MVIIKVKPLFLYSSIKFFFVNIRLIFDIEKWFWNQLWFRPKKISRSKIHILSIYEQMNPKRAIVKCLCQRYWLKGITGTSKLPNFIEITANMIYLVALGLGLKCLHKVHLSTQWGEGTKICQNWWWIVVKN